MSEPLKVIAGTPDRPLVIGDIEIPCYVLEDETRVLSQRGVLKSLAVARGGPRGNTNPKGEENGAQMPRFASQKWLHPFIGAESLVALKSPILFQGVAGRQTYGYPASLLVDLCSAILEADDFGTTTARQEPIVERAKTLIRGFATVGIIALVDEATGYQRIREERALATILEKFIAKNLQPWTKTFPYEFYQEIFRLKGWDGPEGVKRPSIIGVYTNDIVYDRLAPGVLEELQRVNPVLPAGYRKNRHHQWFTRDIGHPKLKEHLLVVIALMRASTNWTMFKRNLARVFPRHAEQIPMHEYE